MGWLFSNRPERPQDNSEAASGVQVSLPPARLSWQQLCSLENYRGRWVALDECAYDGSGHAREGAVVDSDSDLPTLCQRLRDEARKHCAVVFCDGNAEREADPEADPFARSAHR